MAAWPLSPLGRWWRRLTLRRRLARIEARLGPRDVSGMSKNARRLYFVTAAWVVPGKEAHALCNECLGR